MNFSKNIKREELYGIAVKNIETRIKIFKNSRLLDIFIRNKLVLAGGALLSMINYNNISDFDFYFKDEFYVKNLQHDIKMLNLKIDELNIERSESKQLKHIKLVYTSSNALTYEHGKMTYQFIINKDFMNKDAEGIINEFDFNICKIAYDFELDTLFSGENYIKDLKTSNIKFNINTKNPISSLLRVNKYERKGYKLSKIEYLKIALAIQNLELNTYSDVAKQISSVSTVHLKSFVELLNNMADEKFEINKFVELLDDFVEAAKLADLLKDKDESKKAEFINDCDWADNYDDDSMDDAVFSDFDDL